MGQLDEDFIALWLVGDATADDCDRPMGSNGMIEVTHTEKGDIEKTQDASRLSDSSACASRRELK